MTCGIRPLGRLSRIAISFLIMQAAASAAMADGDGRPSWRERCPGASQWVEANSEQGDEAMKARDAKRQLTRPDWLQELQTRVDTEQAARRALFTENFSRASKNAVWKADADNYRWMTDVFAENGLFTAAQVGEYGLHLTWLLVHHADEHRQFQKISLGEFRKRYEAGEVNAQDLARLSDRVAVRFGQPQPYGSQNNWAKGGIDAQDIPDLARIEANRKALGLMSLADYGCMMNAVRGKPDQ